MKSIIRLTLAVALLVLIGCASPPPSPSPALDGSRRTRLHLLVLQDVSTSVDGRVPRTDPGSLEPVLDHAEKCGGTVAFGTFGRVSRPLVRAVFDPPRSAEKAPRVNVFLRPQVKKVDSAATRQEYAARCSAERQRFLERLTELLKESAPITDLGAALARAETFFAEAPSGATRVLIVVSDLQDTTGAGAFALKLDPGVRILLVAHSLRDLGILQGQADRFEWFESVGAALRAAVSEEARP